MGMRPTRSDVARLAGVSVATVSYVVNNGPRTVTEETKARVVSAIEQLGYRPHAIARSLKTGSTRTIGLLVPSLLPHFIAQLANAVEDQLAARDYELLLVSSHEDPARERRLLEVLTDRSVDGLLYIPTSVRNSDHVKQVLDDGIPLVFIDRYIPGVQADVVMSDNRNAAMMATRYLIEQGCRRIICVSFSEEASSALDRVKGYIDALGEHGLAAEPHQVMTVAYATGATVEQALTQYIDTYGMPDGILCTTDSFLTNSIKTLRQLGARVPQDVRVVGGFTASTSPWHALLDLPPFIVQQDSEAMAERAVTRLMARISGDDQQALVEVTESRLIAPPTTNGGEDSPG
jgi:LacI family transcriptional regulator, galactose operon repressor